MRLLLKKKREDLDAYLEMLDTQVPLLGFVFKKTFLNGMLVGGFRQLIY